MANFERKYNQQTGGFDYFVEGRQVDQNAYTEANGGNWWNTLSGSNRKEDNILLGSLLEQSGVQDRGVSKGVLQAQARKPMRARPYGDSEQGDDI